MRSFVLLLRASCLLTSLACAALTQAAHAQSSPVPAPGPVVEPLQAAPSAPGAGELRETLPSTHEPAPVTEPEPAAPATAVGPPELTELHARIDAIARIEALDDSVQRPLDFARAALERSRISAASGDSTAELRTRQLARAAVELADSRLRLLRERALFVATQSRRNASTAEEATARRALERERSRALELARESAAP